MGVDINGLRQTRALKIDRMDELVDGATKSGRDMTEVEALAFDELQEEVTALDKTIERAEQVQKLKATTALPIKQSHDRTAPAESTTFTYRAEPQPRRPEDLGLGFARMVRCLLAAKGQPSIAATIAENKFGDMGVAKALAAGDATAGGFLVPSDYSNEVIELLRNKTVMRRAGARVMPMQGSIDIPRVATTTAATYIGENQNITKTEPTFGNLKATERKLAAIVPISNDLIRLSNPKADALVRDDLLRSMAVTEDLYFLRGAGTGNSPKGIRYWANSSNIAGSAGTSAANMETDLKNLLNALESNNVPLSQPCWIMSPRSKNAMMVARDTNGNLVFPDIKNGTLWGYPVFATSQVPTNLGSGSDSELYLADMADVVIAENEQLLIDVSDTAAYHDGSNVVAAYSQDQTVIRAIARHDLVVRHDYSVAVRTGVAY